MKPNHIIGLLLATGALSQGAVTLTISAVTGATSGVLTNLASSTGDVTSTKVWGILVDTTGNGFAGNYNGGISLSAGATTTLQNSGGATDDVFITSSNIMVNANNATLDGGTVASGTLARPTQIASVAFANGISQGDAFRIMWFDATTLGGTAANGDKYGLYSNAGLIIPADGSTVSFNQLFLGAESTSPGNLVLQGAAVPEPSAALLGAIGALGLLRRRRN